MDYATVQRWLAGLSPLGVQLGTERVEEVLRRLGDPQRRYVALHIAGTNGKGSTAAMSAALLATAARRVAGARIGLYTSPHLLRLTERWQIAAAAAPSQKPPPPPEGAAGPEGHLPQPGGCEAVGQEEFAAAITAVCEAAAQPPAQALTFFEVLTCGAFHWFAGRGVTVAVVETGLGGRLDATRLCQPVATAVTSIGLDHAELLGDTLPEIAREKAGIFRAGVPTAVACDDPAALAALGAEAERVGAPLYQVDTGIGLLAGRAGLLPPLPEDLAACVALPGAHQRRNAAIACFLAAQVPRLAGELGRPEVVREGLLATRWPGRLERLLTDSRGVEVWVDAAHNPEGARALEEWLQAARGARPLAVLFGVVAGKEVSGMLAPLRHADIVVLTRPPSPRGRAPEELLPLLAQSGAGAPPGATPDIVHDVAEAAHATLARVPPGGLMLVYGSIFLIAAVRQLLLGEPADPVPMQDPLPSVSTLTHELRA